jgi:hypothetical protein
MLPESSLKRVRYTGAPPRMAADRARRDRAHRAPTSNEDYETSVHKSAHAAMAIFAGHGVVHITVTARGGLMCRRFEPWGPCQLTVRSQFAGFVQIPAKTVRDESNPPAQNVLPKVVERGHCSLDRPEL